jgi:hypothetical protein
MSRDNSVGIATGYGLDGSASTPGEARHHIQVGSGAHPVLYPVGAGIISRKGKRPELEADLSLSTR